MVSCELVTAGRKTGVCWAQPPQHSHTVRGAKFHGFQSKAEGQEALYMR